MNEATTSENQLAIQEPNRPAAPLSEQREAHAIVKDSAKLYAHSKLLPDSIKDNSYEGTMANCLIALQMAEAMGEMPFVVMQNIHIVKGKAGFAAQYMIARANASGLFRGRLNWRVDKNDPKNLAVTCFATLSETGEGVEFTVDMNMARAEGWAKNSKYDTMPEVMLRYRSATFLVRFYAPDVMLGYRTADEIEDISVSSGVSTEIKPLSADMLLEQSKPLSDKERTEQLLDDEIPAFDKKPEPASATARPDEDSAREPSGSADSGGGQDAAEKPTERDPQAERLDAIRNQVNGALSVEEVNAADKEWEKHMIVYSDDVQSEINKLIAAKRSALRDAQNGQG